MINQDTIKQLVEEKIQGTDRFIVDIVIKPTNKIFVYLDADTQINIDDCVAISRHIESQLDRENEDFELNVSSAGLDQPLKLARQYMKNIGREVKVLLLDGKRASGKLIEANEEKIIIEFTKGKGKTKETIQQEIEQKDIKETKVKISFN